MQPFAIGVSDTYYGMQGPTVISPKEFTYEEKMAAMPHN